MSLFKIIGGTVLHNGKTYADSIQVPGIVKDKNYGGDTIELDENDPEQAEQAAELLRLKVVARPEDLLTAAQARDLTQENEALRQHQADLEQQLAEALARIDAEKSIQ